MERHEVNQALLDLYPNPSYLEIGVSHGTTFHQIRAHRKVAVDPKFQFDLGAARGDPSNANSVYHEVASDTYFARLKQKGEMFDVIYLDGLHTFDQTLRDLLNSIDCLKSNGAIIIDDVMPSSYAASLPDWDESIRFRSLIGDSDQSWMGDVYRLIFFIRDYLPTFHYASLRENHGQTILWRGTRPHVDAPLGVEAIARLDYATAVFQQQAFNYQRFEAIVTEMGRSTAA